MSHIESRPRRREDRRGQFSTPGRPAGRAWWTAAVAVAGAALIGAVIYTRAAGRPAVAADLATADGAPLLSGEVQLDAAQFADGRARFFRYRTASGREVRFFVLKSSDGVIRAALDTCEVCYRARKGYRQEGDAMICNNCGKVFPSAAINVSQGGCNPVPLERAVDGEHVRLAAAALEAGLVYF